MSTTAAGHIRRRLDYVLPYVDVDPDLIQLAIPAYGDNAIKTQPEGCSAAPINASSAHLAVNWTPSHFRF